MKKHIIRGITLFLAFTMLIIFPGCSLRMQPTDTLMHPPRSAGVYDNLQREFTKIVGKDVLLKAPSKGLYRSSFVLYDIDNDLQEEAFIFYAPRNNTAEIHMLFLKKDKVNDDWSTVYDVTGDGSDVSSISFSDLNGDGMYEVILGWKVLSDSYVLSVYKCEFSENSMNLLNMSKVPYSAMKTADMDQDGNDEIFLIASDNTSDTPKFVARMLKMNENSIVVAGETTVNPNVSGYSDILVEEANDQKPLKLYIDANVGDEAMVTDVVYWDSTAKALRAPISNPPSQMRPISYRQAKIKSQDINGDGIIEIPHLVKMEGSAFANKLSADITNKITGTAPASPVDNATFLYYTCWNQQNGGELTTVLYSAINYTDGYIFKFPDLWVNRVTVINNPSERKWTFFEWNSKESSLGEELFSIITVPAEKWTTGPVPEYKILKQSDVVVYAYKLTERADEYSVSEALLNANLVIL